jgi:hypothetical protein
MRASDQFRLGQVHRVHATRDRDCSVMRAFEMRASARSTGIEIAMPMCQVIRFSNDLPIEWRNFAWDTAKMLDALQSNGGANPAA